MDVVWRTLPIMKKTRFVAGLLAGLLMLFSLSPGAMAAVYWGQRGEEVRQVQQKLKQWGYYSGSVDGVFGQSTYNAIIRFQKKNGLTADGEGDFADKSGCGVGFRIVELCVGYRAAGEAHSWRGTRRTLCRHGSGRGGCAESGQEQPVSQYAGGRDLSIRRI